MLSLTCSKYHLYRLSGNYRDAPRCIVCQVAHLTHTSTSFCCTLVTLCSIILQLEIKINSSLHLPLFLGVSHSCIAASIRSTIGLLIFDFERSMYDRKAIEKVSDTSSEKVEYVRHRQEDLSGGNENYTLASDCFREITERHFSSGMDTKVVASSLRQRADRSLSNE